MEARVSTRRPSRRRARRCRRGPGGLTRREFEVLRVVADGKSNKAVARVLWVTDDTVKFHLANIYRRLDVHSRAEAASWARCEELLGNDVEPDFELVPPGRAA
jgi:DNA-binding NarL/FixJ family response regulator